MDINVILFPDFETLDVFGPVEIFGKAAGLNLNYYSEKGGLVKNLDGVIIDTQCLDSIDYQNCDVLFIPGGMGTRIEINNNSLIDKLRYLSEKSKYVLTVCTGSALLAKTGQLDGHHATSNKRSFDWVKSSSNKVLWEKKARWVVDGKFYTSSGVSAGIDMALGFVSDIVYNRNEAELIASRIESNWQQDPTKDDFSL